jgi:Fe-S cluster assembly iron-binding protein IscA
MKIVADREVLDYLKDYLKDKEGKAVRIHIAEACCGLGELEVAYDYQREDDIVEEIEGIKFVAKKEFGFLLNRVELERTLFGIDIMRDYR